MLVRPGCEPVRMSSDHEKREVGTNNGLGRYHEKEVASEKRPRQKEKGMTQSPIRDDLRQTLSPLSILKHVLGAKI